MSFCTLSVVVRAAFVLNRACNIYFYSTRSKALLFNFYLRPQARVDRAYKLQMLAWMYQTD